MKQKQLIRKGAKVGIAALLASSIGFNGGWTKQVLSETQRFEGRPEQWASFPHAVMSAVQQLEVLKAVQRDGKLYAMVKGPGLESGGTWYLDLDGDEETGTSIPYWGNSSGVDVKIADGQIWTLKDGQWTESGVAKEVFKGTVREVELDLASLHASDDKNIRIAFAQPGSQYLPAPGRLMLIVPPSSGEAFGPDVNISVDAKMDDWANVEPAGTSLDGTTTIYSAQDHSYLYLLAKGKMAEFNDIFIDTDRSSDTGYTDVGWGGFGGDWLVENGGLFKSTGAGWNWGYVDGSNVEYAESGTNDDKTIEYRIPLSSMDLTRPRTISLGFTSNAIRVPDTSKRAALVAMPAPKITVDGDAAEWEGLPVTATGQGSVAYMKAFANNKKMAVLAQASSFDKETNVFIDSDNNFETGYQGWEYKRTGADYLVQNGTLYKSAGAGWVWNEIGPVPWKVTNAATSGQKQLELEADLSSFANVTDSMRVSIGVGGDYAPATSSDGEYALATGLSGGTIEVDGNDSDWSSIDQAVKGKGDKITVRAAQDKQKVYLFVEGDSIDTRNTFYLDTDANPETGMKNTEWEAIGSDAMIKYNQLYLYNNENKSWEAKGPVRAEATSDHALYYFYQDQIGREEPNPIRIGYVGKEAYHLPTLGQSALQLTDVIHINHDPNVFEPKERFGVLNNPYMGWVGWANTNKPLYQPHSLVYANITWRDLEPEKGVFNWERIESKFQFEKWGKEGTRINLRFVLDDPGNGPEKDIPDWLYNELVQKEGKDGAGKWYDTPSSVVGSGFAPNYSSQTLIAEHERAIKALAERYNNDSRIAFIQIGSLGHWGEFHNWPEEVSGKFPNLSVSEQYVNHYIENFTNKMIGMRKPFPIAAKNNLGLFNDVFGSKGATDTWIDWTVNGWNEIGSYVDNGQDPAEAQAASKMPEFWKKNFSGGEFHSGNSLLSLSDDTIMESLRQMRDSHSSWMGPSSPVSYEPGKDITEGQQANINLMHNSMGYRFVLESVDSNNKAEIGENLNLSMVWNNKGVAPFYFKWPLAVALTDNQGNIISDSVQKVESVDIREWLPGRHTVNTQYSISKNLKPGRYKLVIAILDKESGLPGIKLGIDGERADGWTELKAFTVSR